MNRSLAIVLGILAVLVIVVLLFQLSTRSSYEKEIHVDGDAVVSTDSSPLEGSWVDAASERGTVVGAESPSVVSATETSAHDLAAPAAATARASLIVRVFWEADGLPAHDISAKLTYSSGSEYRRRIRLGSTGLDGVLHAKDLPVGRATVNVDRRVSRDVELRPDEVAVVEMPLAPGIDTDVLVVTPSGVPARDAQVWLTYDGSESARFFMGTTDATGRVQCRGLHARDALVAYHLDYFPSQHRAICITPRPCETRLELTPGTPVSLVGRVTDDRGEPIADASVQISTSVRMPDTPSVMKRWDSPTDVLLYTDREGQFESPPLAVGIHELDVDAPSYSRVQRKFVEYKPIPRPILIQLPDGIRIEGRVRDEQGNACPEVGVSAGTSSAISDSNGLYALTGVDRRTDRMFAWHSTLGGAELALKLEPGESVHQDITLSRGRMIRGRVVLEDGSPLAGWMVCVGAEPRRRGNWAQHTYTAADGSFTLTNCAAEALRLEIRAKDAAYHSIVKEVAGVMSDSAPLIIRIARDEIPTAVIFGRLMGLAELTIRPSLYFQYASEVGSTNFGVSYDSDGAFKISELAPGEYRVLLRCDDAGQHEIAKVSLTVGQSLDLGSISCR